MSKLIALALAIVAILAAVSRWANTPLPKPEPPKPEPDDPIKKLNAPAQALIAAGRVFVTKTGQVGIISTKTGVLNDKLQAWSQEHAELQANRERQGHDPLSRLNTYLAAFPGCEVSEICNESWPGQSLEDAAKEMYHSWEQSSGHWEVANWDALYWGYAMALGKNGTWYASALVARKK